MSRHHPDFCPDKLQQLLAGPATAMAGANLTSSAPSGGPGEGRAPSSRLPPEAGPLSRRVRIGRRPPASGAGPLAGSRRQLEGGRPRVASSGQLLAQSQAATTNDLSGRRKRDIQDQGKPAPGERDTGRPEHEPRLGGAARAGGPLCADRRPAFVAQSSICWYVLGAGLSCYLLDLLLRRLRRSRGPIELLAARTDAGGQLVELVLSSNHRRFLNWSPGQFVYLNCPQVAGHEWHPFTVSSMDNETRQFTLHIKPAGDWTSRLRNELERATRHRRRRPVAGERCAFDEGAALGETNPAFKQDPAASFQGDAQAHGQALAGGRPADRRSEPVNMVANFADHHHQNRQDNGHWLVSIGQRAKRSGRLRRMGLGAEGRYSICPLAPKHNGPGDGAGLKLFVDGPFHSPFERLLEQQVSVCIANGIGWTAFSSVFQQLADLCPGGQAPDSWWWRWRHFQPLAARRTQLESGAPAPRAAGRLARLHLMVILTTMEQFKPFYGIVGKYFESTANSGRQPEAPTSQSPVREVTAFITRCECPNRLRPSPLRTASPANVARQPAQLQMALAD